MSTPNFLFIYNLSSPQMVTTFLISPHTASQTRQAPHQASPENPEKSTSVHVVGLYGLGVDHPRRLCTGDFFAFKCAVFRVEAWVSALEGVGNYHSKLAAPKKYCAPRHELNIPNHARPLPDVLFFFQEDKISMIFLVMALVIGSLTCQMPS